MGGWAFSEFCERLSEMISLLLAIQARSQAVFTPSGLSASLTQLLHKEDRLLRHLRNWRPPSFPRDFWPALKLLELTMNSHYPDSYWDP